MKLIIIKFWICNTDKIQYIAFGSSTIHLNVYDLLTNILLHYRLRDRVRAMNIVSYVESNQVT